jgi:hypothetical protein
MINAYIAMAMKLMLIGIAVACLILTWRKSHNDGFLWLIGAVALWPFLMYLDQQAFQRFFDQAMSGNKPQFSLYSWLCDTTTLRISTVSQARMYLHGAMQAGLLAFACFRIYRNT